MSDRTLIITGMHRAHTSSFAESLSNAGLFLGDDLYAATRYNARGHFESKQIVAFHNNLLDKYRARSWFQLINKQELKKGLSYARFNPLAKQLISDHFKKDQFGWKDPRAAFFLTYWDNVLEEAKYIFVFRDPVYTVQSLIRRSLKHSKIKFRPLLATRYFNLWDATYKSILDFYNQNTHRCILIHAPDVFTSESSLDQLNEVVINKWKFELQDIEFSHFDSNLISIKEPSFYLNKIVRGRKETQRIYKKMIRLAGEV